MSSLPGVSVVALLAMAMAITGGCASAERIASAAPENDSRPDSAAPALAARAGKALYARYCVLCHGAGGQGDGVNAPNLEPAPRDHTDRGWAARRSDEQLFAAVRDGYGQGRAGRMPPFGRTLRPYQIWDLVAHLRELGRAKPRPEARRERTR